jgi:hypothetical protein
MDQGLSPVGRSHLRTVMGPWAYEAGSAL